MSTIPVYTIGYGNRSIEDFIALLQRYEIQYLADIRSQPYSRFNPDYSQKALQQHLKRHSIGYIFMGDQLGGQPKERSLHRESPTEKSQVDYEKLAQSEAYKKGIERIQYALRQQWRIVLMCSELKPTMCHRGKLVGKTLSKLGFEVIHIDEKGNQKTQLQLNRILDGAASEDNPTLFEEWGVSNDEAGHSRKKYTVGEEGS